jgi:hypothetical protein
MVDLALTVGGIVGVLLSGGFVYGEIGRFATPQVPETVFDERREVFGYTAGLFVGVPLALALLFYLASMGNGAIPGALLFLAALVGATEVAQWALLRTRYWGSGESRPFYVLGYRAGIAGILGLTVVAQYLSGSTITALGVALVVLEAGAILALEVAGALLSLPPSEALGRRSGGPLPGAIFGAFGFFLLGIAALSGTATASAEATTYASVLVALLGGALVYHRLRPMLGAVRPPSAGARALAPSSPAAFGRTDRERAAPPGRRD